MISSNLSDLAEMVEKNRNGKTVVLATGTQRPLGLDFKARNKIIRTKSPHAQVFKRGGIFFPFQRGSCFIICFNDAVELGLIFASVAGHRSTGDPVCNAVSLFAQLHAVGLFESIAQRLCACGVRGLRPHGRTYAGIASGEHGQCHQADQQAGQ